MKDFIKSYVMDIVWALLVTLFEIAILSACIFILISLPHGIIWLNYSFIQCFILICTYRLITYKMNKTIQPNDINELQESMPPWFNTLYNKEEPELNTRPVRNVYSSSEMEELNHESEFSVRE